MILGIFIGVFFMYAVLVFGTKIDEDDNNESRKN